MGVPLFAQVPAPKHERLFHHLFAPHADNPSLLEQRSKNLSCALVLIVAGNRAGTGFYISADGDIATAAHVLGNKIVAELPDGRARITLVSPIQIFIKNSVDQQGERFNVGEVLENNADAFSA